MLETVKEKEDEIREEEKKGDRTAERQTARWSARKKITNSHEMLASGLRNIWEELSDVFCCGIGSRGAVICKHIPCDFTYLPGAVLFSRFVSVVV